MSKIQLILKEGQPEYAVLPYDVYLQLVEDAEMYQDIRDYDEALAQIANGDEELIPSHVTYALLEGENPVNVWREYRNMTQQALAEAAGISKQLLHYSIKQRTLTQAHTIAKAFGLDARDLIIEEN